MNEKGKVEEFNGFYGIIKSDDGKHYLLLKEEIMKEFKNSINKQDSVSFKSEIYKNSEIEQYIARFVKKRSK
jgi:hypothetical protein